MAKGTKRKKGVLDIVLMRLVWAAILVFGTFNPTGWSIFHLIKNKLPAGNGWVVLGIMALAGLHIVFISVALKLSHVAKGFIALFTGGIVYLAWEQGLFVAGETKPMIWLALIIVMLIYTFAMSSGHIWRKASGRVATDEGDGHDDEE